MSLSGPLALQGQHAARGLELWASVDQIELTIVDDASSATTAIDAYQRWLASRVDLLLGPYGSRMVRRVVPIVSRQGALLWNHGGSADDIARPLVVSVSAPASTYFRGAVALAHRMGLRRVVLARGKGPFASAVVAGARQQAAARGLAVREVQLAEWSTVRSLTEAAVLIVGTFAEDLTVVEQIRASREPGLLGCVAAGLPEFGNRLGPLADGVVGPVQWICRTTAPEVGLAGADFLAPIRNKIRGAAQLCGGAGCRGRISRRLGSPACVPTQRHKTVEDHNAARIVRPRPVVAPGRALRHHHRVAPRAPGSSRIVPSPTRRQSK